MDSVKLLAESIENLKQASTLTSKNYTYEYLRFTIGKIVSDRGNPVPKRSIDLCANTIAIAVCNVGVAPTPRNKNTTKANLINKSVIDIIKGGNAILNDVADLRNNQASEYIYSYQNFLNSIVSLNQFSHIDHHGKGQDDRRILHFIFLEIYKKFSFRATNNEMIDLLWCVARSKADDWVYKHLTLEAKNKLVAMAELEKQMTRAKENTQYAHINSTPRKKDTANGLSTIEGLKQIKAILNSMENKQEANEIKAIICDYLLDDDSCDYPHF